jgi:single-strand DNA-binding protein
MNGTLNKVMLIGNLGMDPEIRYFDDGRSLGRLRIATTEVYRDREGNRQERTDWHTVVVRNRLAELCKKYLRKGSKIFVEGRIQYRDYIDNQGQQRFVAEIIATNIDFLSPRNQQTYQSPAEGQAAEPGQAKSSSADITKPESPGKSDNEPETDLPF